MYLFIVQRPVPFGPIAMKMPMIIHDVFLQQINDVMNANDHVNEVLLLAAKRIKRDPYLPCE